VPRDRSSPIRMGSLMVADSSVVPGGVDYRESAANCDHGQDVPTGVALQADWCTRKRRMGLEACVEKGGNSRLVASGRVFRPPGGHTRRLELDWSMGKHAGVRRAVFEWVLALVAVGLASVAGVSSCSENGGSRDAFGDPEDMER